MGVFASWLAGLIGNLAALLGLSLAKKTIFLAAAIAASISITLAFAYSIKAMVLTVVVDLPAWAATGAMFLPSNTGLCISLVISAKIARFIYDWNMSHLRMASKYY